MRINRLLLTAVVCGGVVVPLAVLAATRPPTAATMVQPVVPPVPAASAPVPPTAPGPVLPEPEPVVVVVGEGDGVPVVVPGTGARVGDGPLRRYTVAVEGGLQVEPAAFAAEVEAVLSDPRSWGAEGRLAFQRVDADPVDVRVVLASPATTDRLCEPLVTGGSVSCGIEGSAVLNVLRWQTGADAYAGDLPGYRQYLVNHEVGHTLGHGHAPCPGPGEPAPVMMQQTLGTGDCLASPWPFPG